MSKKLTKEQKEVLREDLIDRLMDKFFDSVSKSNQDRFLKTAEKQNPTLYLKRGEIYEFVNNSGGSHPFQIRVSNGGAAYNNGVTNNGASSGTIRFEVPYNAPDTLYYQCTNHSSMGGDIKILGGSGGGISAINWINSL